MSDCFDIEKLGKALLNETLKELLRRVKAGEASAADLNVARAACKDLNIQMIPTPTNVAGQLGAALNNLPFPSAPHEGLDDPVH